MALQQRVLVVEDDGASRRMLRMLVGFAGYAVDEATNGAAGLERLRTSQAHGERVVALVDLAMPTVSGVRLFQAVAMDAPLARQHAYILVTAHWGRLAPLLGSLCECLHAPTVLKPFDNDHLLEVVADAAARLV